MLDYLEPDLGLTGKKEIGKKKGEMAKRKRDGDKKNKEKRNRKQETPARLSFCTHTKCYMSNIPNVTFVSSSSSS